MQLVLDIRSEAGSNYRLLQTAKNEAGLYRTLSKGSFFLGKNKSQDFQTKRLRCGLNITRDFTSPKTHSLFDLKTVFHCSAFNHKGPLPSELCLNVWFLICSVHLSLSFYVNCYLAADGKGQDSVILI